MPAVVRTLPFWIMARMSCARRRAKRRCVARGTSRGPLGARGTASSGQGPGGGGGPHLVVLDLAAAVCVGEVQEAPGEFLADGHVELLQPRGQLLRVDGPVPVLVQDGGRLPDQVLGRRLALLVRVLRVEEHHVRQHEPRVHLGSVRVRLLQDVHLHLQRHPQPRGPEDVWDGVLADRAVQVSVLLELGVHSCHGRRGDPVHPGDTFLGAEELHGGGELLGGEEEVPRVCLSRAPPR